MMGRPLSEATLRRMRVLLFEHDLAPPAVAARMGLSERVVQAYRKQWMEGLQAASADLKGLLGNVHADRA